MAALDAEREIRELKRRLDLAETRPSQLEGRFEFVSGQLRDIRLYMHARFGDIEGRLEGIERRQEAHDKRFDAHDRRFDVLEAKIDAIPRAVAELIAGRDGR